MKIFSIEGMLDGLLIMKEKPKSDVFDEELIVQHYMVVEPLVNIKKNIYVDCYNYTITEDYDHKVIMRAYGTIVGKEVKFAVECKIPTEFEYVLGAINLLASGKAYTYKSVLGHIESFDYGYIERYLTARRCKNEHYMSILKKLKTYEEPKTSNVNFRKNSLKRHSEIIEEFV